MTTPARLVENVGYAYERGRPPALDGVSFAAQPGRFTALLGPNGAGKTTLLALATRLFAPASGRILVAGVDLAVDPAAALARLGVVFQQPTLDPDLTVRQNLLYFAALHGLSRAEAAARADEALARLNMAERAREPARRLNGGHRRRLELARALTHRPSLLILDEPTVGLDPPARRAIVDHVHDLCAFEGVAALWTTHLIDEVRDEDDVVLLAKGRVRAQGRARDVAEAYGGGSLAAAFTALTAPPETTPPEKDAAP